MYTSHMTKNRRRAYTTHLHEFVVNNRNSFGGYYCRICGFRIPENLAAHAKDAGAKFPEETQGVSVDEFLRAGEVKGYW